MTADLAYGQGTMPAGIRSRFVPGVNGLTIHVLEAGYQAAGRPAILLLHGFPELAFSWRKVMLPLAEAGYHVVAPDQRGYGRTTGWDGEYDGDLFSYRRLNLVRDAMGLIAALGYRSVRAVVGHDFGSPIAAWCAVARPDVFQSVVLMSAPFPGTGPFPFVSAGEGGPGRAATGPSLREELARLPRPRKHYQHYFQSREAGANMRGAPQGILAFLRAYYHYKSADWTDNRPFRLAAATAAELARMPTYYVMDLDKGMAETVASATPSSEQVAANAWLPDRDLAVYGDEFARTGFQGGLQWYRAGSLGAAEMEIFAGRTIDQPSLFIGGAADWGVYQSPGALEAMRDRACTDFRGLHLVEGAGHWVQQERPEETARLLISFLAEAG